MHSGSTLIMADLVHVDSFENISASNEVVIKALGENFLRDTGGLTIKIFTNCMDGELDLLIGSSVCGRNGRRSYDGTTCTHGIVIDVTGVDRFQVIDKANGVARLGAGLTLFL